MREYRILLGLALRNRLAGLRAGSWRKSNGKVDVGRIVGTAVAVLGVVCLAGMMIYAEIKLFGGLAAFGQPALLPALIVMMCMIGTLFLGFFHTIASLYFSRDTAWMAYLPVHSRTVMAAKMTEIWLGEMLFCAAVLSPAFILYGGYLHADALYYVRMAVTILLAPVLPLSVTLLLSSLLARLTALSRHKESWVMIGSLVMMFSIIALEMRILPHIPDDADAMFFIRLLMDSEGLVSMLTGGFPPVMWAVRGIAGDWGQFMLLVLCCAVVSCALIYLLGGSYLNVCLRQGEQGSRKRAVKTTNRTWKVRSPLMALFHREWTEVLKTPTYAFNSFSGVIMVPLMLFAMSMGLSANDAGNVLDLLDELISSVDTTDMILILTALVAFAGFLDPAIATAVSREGGRHDISRMIPVSARTQITAKMMMGLCVNGLAVVTACITVGVIMPSLIPMLIPAMLLAMMECFAVSALCLTLDAIRPNLHWTSETQVIKQGANVAFGMLIGFAMYALPVAAAVLLIKAEPIARLASVVGILTVECAVGFMLLRLVAEKRYVALEDSMT